jgi:hypothetical protein
LQRGRLRHAASHVRADAATQLRALGEPAIPALRDALKDSHPNVRLAAIASLQQLAAPQAVHALITALDDGDPEVCANAVAGLSARGGEVAEDALCLALEHRDRNTHIAAAQALGVIGGPRVVPHLLAAHRRCFLGRSARGQLFLGLGILAAVSLTFFAFTWGTYTAKMFGLTSSGQFIIRGGIAYFHKRQEQSRVAAAISDALLQIAERSSAPEIHRIVPELRMVSRDRLQHSRETRAAARNAADRIEALTASLQQLPLASSAAEAPAAAQLPCPSSAPVQAARLQP